MKSKKKYVLSLLTILAAILICSATYSTNVEAAGMYTLQINKGTNVVTVYTLDGTPYTAFICSTGYATPVGTFNTQAKYRWKELFFSSYGQYSTRITSDILFHSVPYSSTNQNAQSYYNFNQLGTTASHGCVRLTTRDAKWIYDNCPLGTTVTIINGTSANDPLGKPATIKVDASLRRGWDPTDPDPANPYANNTPYFSVANWGPTVEYGGSVDYSSVVTAYDSLGNNVTSMMTTTGTIDTYKLGSYSITFSITDAIGRSASTTVVFRVVDSANAIISGVKADATKEYNSSIYIKKGVSAKTPTGTKLTGKIKITVQAPGSKKAKTYKKSKLKLKKLGTYKICYSVTNPNNNKITTVVRTVKVQDTKAPVVKGVTAAKTVEYGTSAALKKGITAKLVSGKSVKPKMLVYMKTPKSTKWVKLGAKKIASYKFTKLGTYKIKYVATNAVSKKKTSMISKIKVVDTKAPVLSGVAATQTAEYNTTMNLLANVTAKKVSGAKLTSAIQISVLAPEHTEWTAISRTDAAAYTFDTLGTYQFQYTTVNTTSQKSTVSTMTVTVADTKAPTLTLSSEMSSRLQAGSTADTYIFTGSVGDNLDWSTDALTALLASGTPVTADITLTDDSGTVLNTYTNNQNDAVMTFTEAGTYTIMITSANPSNTSAISTITIAVTIEAVEETETEIPPL